MAVDFSKIDDACLSAFGSRTVTFTPQVGDPETLTVIPLESAEGESDWPGATLFFEVPASEITTAPIKGDSVSFEGVDYEVQAAKESELGAFTVECRKT